MASAPSAVALMRRPSVKSERRVSFNSDVNYQHLHSSKKEPKLLEVCAALQARKDSEMRSASSHKQNGRCALGEQENDLHDHDNNHNCSAHPHESWRESYAKQRRRKWSKREAITRSVQLLGSILGMLQSQFSDETFIITNNQGTIYRFSKAKSLFLFDSTSRLRKFVCNLMIQPMFGHFIMLVIICNCACMVLAEPPQWIDEYLEYVFTAIYIAEAIVKIIACGFVLHQFSYLRDPWNWLDFTVIMAAIITTILKAVVSGLEVGQLAVLRAFRVLRALKTMSVIPDLRAIVKALLHSIRALKDAVALTVFIVSVFALVGYQLFHGTLRQKCVRIPGTTDLPPDSLYMSLVEGENLFEGANSSSFPLALTSQDFRTTPELQNKSGNALAFLSMSLLPLYRTAGAQGDGKQCHEYMRHPDANGKDWSYEDATLLREITEAANATIFAHNASTTHRIDECFLKGKAFLETHRWSSLLGHSQTKQADSNTSSNTFLLNTTNDAHAINVSAQFYVADLACVNNASKPEKSDQWSPQNVTNVTSDFTLYFDDNTTGIDLQSKVWLYFRENVPRWNARQYVVIFQLKTSLTNDVVPPYFVFLSEKSDLGEEQQDWYENTDNFCMVIPSTGSFYYPNSSNRPPPEPIYCAIGDEETCPRGYECVSAGPNPDYGYTTYDHFFLAFLTSFRLVALDAWGRLYYLTLHTVGRAYALFYVVVVLLGSYYLINLILAVVYMSYEEQNAEVEDEELEARVREAEKMEEENRDDVVSIRYDNEDSNSDSDHHDQERGCRRMSLITTSLTSHERAPNVDGGLSHLDYLESIRRRRRMLRRRSVIMLGRDPNSEEEEPLNWQRRSITRRRSVRGRIESCSHSPRPDSSDCSCEDLRRSVRHRRSRSGHRSRRRQKTSFSQPSTPVMRRAKIPSPLFQFTVTEADDCRTANQTGFKEPAYGDQEPCSPQTDKQFLSIESAYFRSRLDSTGSGSDISTCHSVPEKYPCSPLSGTLKVPFFRRERRLSETLSVGDEESICCQVVQADVNHSPETDRNSVTRKKLNHAMLPKYSDDNNETKVTLNNNRKDLVGSDVKIVLPPSYDTLIRTSKTQIGTDFLATDEKIRLGNGKISRRSSSCSQSTSTMHQGKPSGKTKTDGSSNGSDEITQLAEHRSKRAGPKFGEVLRRKWRRFWKIFLNAFAKWNCCPAGWRKVRESLENVVLNPFTDLFITLCIVFNTLFLCIEHHPMEESFAKMLENANLFFTIVFTVEMVLKIIGLTPYIYFRQRWNLFDAFVVFFSCLELVLDTTQGLSALRAFRLMRILKLAKQWPTLNKLLTMIGTTVGKLWHLTIVFILVMFIFALIGMQLLRTSYLEYYQDNQPRWNFVDFPHAVMVVFRIQCGEWVENMINCLNVASPGVCIPLFILVYLIGNLVILNLFIALLLNSLSGDALQQPTTEKNSISAALRHVVLWGRKVKKRLSQIPLDTYCCLLVKLGVRSSPAKIIDSIPAFVEMRNLDNGARNGKLKVAQPSMSNDLADEESEAPAETDTLVITTATSNGHAHRSSSTKIDADEAIEQQNTEKRRTRRHHHHRHSNRLHRHHPSRHRQPVQNGNTASERISECSQTHDGQGDHEVSVANALTSNSDVHGLSRVRRHSCRRHSVSSVPRIRRESAISVSEETSGKPRGNVSPRLQKKRDTVHSPAKIFSLASLDSCNDSIKIDEEEEEVEEEKAESCDDDQKKDKLDPCLPFLPGEPLEEGAWFRIRSFTHKVVVHRYFDHVVIFCILLSSVTLAFEDVHIDNNPAMKKFVHIIDIFCCVFFFLEMILKWIGYGLKKYFTNAWCILDFVIVTISILNLTLSGSQSNLSALRVLRTFRALRPLRALSRFEGMKIVVDALIRAVPSIAHVSLICVMFWLIFSILGVNLFAGRLGRCVALPTNDILPRRFAPNDTIPVNLPSSYSNKTLEELCSRNNTQLIQYLNGDKTVSGIDPITFLPAVRDKTECLMCSEMLNTSDINWQIPNINFDSALRGYLVLMQVATFNGWLEIMESAVDVTGVEEQPVYEASFYNYIYFCVFIVFGAFFSLNLFIGVIIDNFNQQKTKSKDQESGVLMTEEQRKYYNAMKQMQSKTPKKPIPRPNNKFANSVYNLVTSRKFEMTVMALIMLNMVVMAVEHHDMSHEMTVWLQYFNLGFITLFVVEAILKLIGLRFYYFTIPWNVFDFFVVIVSLIATGFSDVLSQYFVQPTLFRIIRLFRVTRVLRLIREAKGIRTLLFALMMSLPALFNIGCLLFLFMFIYAIIGMSQFPHVQKIAGIDNLLNFETFPNAFLVLFEVSTSESWDRFIEPILRDEEPYCDAHPVDGSPSNCGNSILGVIYFVTYVMITFLIVVNMYIAIILENFVVATRESAEPLTADDFEQFFEVWQRYDDRLTQYITYEQLKNLLNHLDYPLRVPQPNSAFIAQSKMRITRDGRVHCLEVIIALIKKVLGDSPELNNLKDAMFESFMIKCRVKETFNTEETMDAGEFTLLYRATLTIQRIFRERRERRFGEDSINSESDGECDEDNYSSTSENDQGSSSDDKFSENEVDICNDTGCCTGSSCSGSSSSHSSRCSVQQDDDLKR